MQDKSSPEALEVSLRSPVASELEALVQLRNQARQWFGDQSELSMQGGASWIAARTEDDSLKCIVKRGVVIGTIGWVKIAHLKAAYEIGRLIGDYGDYEKRHLDAAAIRYGLRAGSWLALDHLFGVLSAQHVFARIRPKNGLVRNMMREFRLEPATWPGPTGAEAKAPNWECWAIDAARWALLRKDILQRSIA